MNTQTLAMQFEVVIGLEIHVQLLTASKMFCACPVTFGAPPNTLICPVCLGLPGSLPVLNRKVVDLGLRTAAALGCTVHPTSQFQRSLHQSFPGRARGRLRLPKARLEY